MFVIVFRYSPTLILYRGNVYFRKFKKTKIFKIVCNRTASNKYFSPETLKIYKNYTD